MSTFRGTGHDDTLTGSSNNDNFLLWQGGSDTVDGGGGNDIFRMGAALDAGDKLDGGTGKDFLILNGDYSAGLVLNADTITNIEVMALVGGHSYKLTTNDGNVAAGQMLLVRGDTLGSGNTLTFDGSAELDGKFTIIGGTGSDILTGGARHDVFDLSHGGNDTAHGGGGTDLFVVGNTINGGDFIDGGAGNDTVTMGGAFGAGTTLSFSTANFTGIDTIRLDAMTGVTTVTISNDITSGGASLTVDASGMGASAVNFNGGLLSSKEIHFTGSDGDDNLLFTALQAGDTLDGGAGSNKLILGATSYTFGDVAFTNFQTLQLGFNISVDVTMADANVAAGQTLAVIHNFFNGFVHFDGSAETDGHFALTINGSTDDILTGGALSDTFTLIGSGNDTVHGGDGDDLINFGSTLNSLDVVDGGAGNDTLELGGPGYFARGGLVHDTSLEGLIVDAGFDYNFVIANAVVDAGATFTFDASALGSGNTATFDASDDNDSHFYLIGGAGDDSLTASGGNTFDLTLGGNDTAVAFGPGTFLLGNQLSAGDFVQGNIGSTVVMGGAFTAGTTLGISTGNFDGIANFHFDATTGVTGVVFSGAIPNAGEVMALDASAMGTTAVSFDFSGAIAASFSIIGSGGNDTITLSGSGANSVTAGLGADMIACGAAADTIITGAVADSSGAGAYDTISGFNFDADQFNLAGAHSVSGFAATAASVDSTSFDADIFAASAGHLAGDGALSITAILGNLTGHTFLIVDVNNDGVYLAGTDYVFDITGFTGTPDAGDFI